MALITITRKTGSGGHEIAERVAKRLSVELYDDKKLQDEALKLGICRDDIKGMDEKAPGFFDQILSRKPEMYRELMEAVVYEVSRRGEGVIVGHGSQILLQDFHCALHVFIHAADDLRIQRFMETGQLSREAAKKLIRKNDNEREGYFRYAFQLDMKDPALYDLIINTGKIVPELAAGVIVDTVRSEQINECGIDALRAMENLTLGKKIMAALLKNHINTSMLYIEVGQEGVAVIRGHANSREQKKRLVSIVESVPGVTQVRADISGPYQDYS